MAQQLSNQRIAWFNGEFMPEREVRIPFRDSSWVYGDGCFDMLWCTDSSEPDQDSTERESDSRFGENRHGSIQEQATGDV